MVKCLIINHKELSSILNTHIKMMGKERGPDISAVRSVCLHICTCICSHTVRRERERKHLYLELQYTSCFSYCFFPSRTTRIMFSMAEAYQGLREECCCTWLITSRDPFNPESPKHQEHSIPQRLQIVSLLITVVEQ